MCDYSLHGIPNRLAEEGEILVVHRFYTGSKGLTSPEHLKTMGQPKDWWTTLTRMFAAQSTVCAVCIPDGAQLVLSGISSALQQAYGLSATEAVTFRQLSANAGTYRDAVEFRSGMKVRLQDLQEGQSVEVVALSPEKGGAREERSGRRLVWHADSPYMHRARLSTPGGAADVYSYGERQLPNSPRRFGR